LVNIILVLNGHCQANCKFTGMTPFSAIYRSPGLVKLLNGILKAPTVIAERIYPAGLNAKQKDRPVAPI
jgi:hypothetical protein